MFLFSAFSLSKTIPSKPNCEVLFQEAFNLKTTPLHWIPTEAKNYTNDWIVRETQIPQTMKNEMALYATGSNTYSAVSRKLEKPINVTAKNFVLQYEMRPEFAFTCSGAYIKLLGKNFEPEKFTNETEYSIMFGPDRCGQNRKVHFIFNEIDPVTKELRKVELDDAPQPLEDQMTHLYTLVLRKDNSYSIFIDNTIKKNGKLDHSPRIPLVYGIGFEIWHVNRDISFNNIMIATDEMAIFEWNNENFIQRQKYQRQELKEGLTYDWKTKIADTILNEWYAITGSCSTPGLIFLAASFLVPLFINICGFTFSFK
jgi:hypothetical protein